MHRRQTPFLHRVIHQIPLGKRYWPSTERVAVPKNEIVRRDRARRFPLNFAKNVPGWPALALHVSGGGLPGYTDAPAKFCGRQLALLEIIFQVHAMNVTTMAPPVNRKGANMVRYAGTASVTLYVAMNRLSEILEEKGISNAELARRTGVSRQQIGRLRTGKRKLTTQWAEQLAPSLGVEPIELFAAPAEIYDFKVDEILRRVRERTKSKTEARHHLIEIRRTIDAVLDIL